MWTSFLISVFAWGWARSKLGVVDTSILHHDFISIFIALWAVITHEEGECRQLEFRAGKGANIRDLFCTTPKVLKLHGACFWNIYKILGEKRTRGGPPASHKGGGRALPPTPWARPLPCGPPGRPPLPIFGYELSFTLEKIKKKFSGRSTAVSRRNLGRTNLRLRRSCSAEDTSLREGEIITIVMTNAPLIGRGQSPSTYSPAPSHLQTLVHLLYPILVSKSGIGASSVDYSF